MPNSVYHITHKGRLNNMYVILPTPQMCHSAFFYVPEINMASEKNVHGSQTNLILLSSSVKAVVLKLYLLEFACKPKSSNVSPRQYKIT